MKKVLYYIYYGVSWGFFVFVGISLIGYLIIGPEFIVELAPYYGQQVLASALAGIVCAGSSIVYTFDSLSFKKQMLIHFSTGITGYILIGLLFGWIPLNFSVRSLLSIIFGVIAFVVIWSCFYLYNYFEAKSINKKIKEKNI